MLRADRRQLVGLLAPEILEEGAQIVADPNAPVPVPMLGHVTSAYWSETLAPSDRIGAVVRRQGADQADAVRTLGRKALLRCG